MFGCQTENSNKVLPKIIPTIQPAIKQKHETISLNEGPNSTGALKEGPNSTGSIKLGKQEKETHLLLTQKINHIENPLIPENIKSIEIIIPEGKKILKAQDIILNKTNFAIKATDPEISLSFDGSGNFILKVDENVKNIILKIYLKNNESPAVIPVLDKLISDNIRATIEQNDKGQISIFGGVSQKDGSLDKTKPTFSVSYDEKGELYLKVITSDNKTELYLLNQLEESIENNKDLPEAQKSENNGTEDDKKSIENNIEKISSLSNYIGNWICTINKFEINVVIVDKGNGVFSGKTILNKKTYAGEGKYSLDLPNEFLIIESIDNNASLRIKMTPQSPNTLKFKIEEITIPEYKIYKGTAFVFTRNLDS